MGSSMLAQRLKQLGQLKGRIPKSPLGLVQLCNQRRLHGGLSIDLRVTPDEAFAPVVTAMELSGLKLLDVRTAPQAVVLEVKLHDGSIEKWELSDVEALVHNLNDLCRLQPEALPCAVLGEWEDMLQLWCVDKPTIATGLQERWLEARNTAILWKLLEA